jgi:uncharacterized protein (DUF3084 family)
MGEEGFVRMVLQDAAKWRQESEDDYDADTSRLEAEIGRLRVEVSQLQADLAESEEEVGRQYHEAQVAEGRLARVEAVLDEHGQWYSGPLLYRALCEALGIEPK